MSIKKGQEIEIAITDMAVGGRGLARVDGLVVFVDHTMPGDIVIARILKKKKSYAEARLTAILFHSPFRVIPPCPYSGFCGGCKWQFVDYPKQLDFKQQHVLDTLAHLALLDNVTVHPTLASPDIFGYRNKMEFSLSDKRWLLPEEIADNGDGELKKNADFAVGLHVPGTFHKVLDIEACLLQPDEGNRILKDAREFIRASALPVYGLKSHEGFWRFLMLRHSSFFDRWLINVITAREEISVIKDLAAHLTGRHPQIVSVVNNITSRKAGIAVGEYEVGIYGDPVIKDRIGNHEFEISANSFFQTNTRGAENLYQVVRQYAELSGEETVFDLYCGAGTISIFLADAASRIKGFEAVESAVTDAEKNCRINGISNCMFIRGDIRETLASAAEVPDVMIIDPPRVGMHKDVVSRVLEVGPEKIVYVSCNPATLARDLGLMKDRYRVHEIQPVDMFPQTFHIECVAKLTKI
jgi:23S rRNA (uracil1939-C5)-methyltransferase